MHLTLRQLQVFQAVARHLSYTRAAEELHLTQPAVSMQMRQLEGTVGIALFEQVGKRTFLTEAGQELQRYSRTISQQLTDVEAVFNDLKGLKHGRLKLSVASTANYFLPQLLAAFSHRHPGVTISLDVTNRQGLLRQLDENETDIVVMGKTPEERDLESYPFRDNPLVIIAPPDHRLAKRKNILLDELADEVFLVRERGSGTRVAMERFFAARNVSIRTGMEAGSNEAVKQSVRAGLGLGLLSRDTLEMELALKLLVVLRVTDFPIARKWYVVHRRGKRLNRSAAEFKRFLTDEVNTLKATAARSG